MSGPLAPLPLHLIRCHSAPLTCLCFSNDNERLISGDTSGFIVVTSTRSLRPLSTWKAHSDSLLGVEEWGKHIITHGRDNRLHVWTSIDTQIFSSNLGSSAAGSGLPAPELCYSMDVNALNYCRFSLLEISVPPNTRALPKGRECESDNPEYALIALPNLVESSQADIWLLPTCQRIHAAIGKPFDRSFAVDGRGVNGIIMALHLYNIPCSSHLPSSSGSYSDELRLLCAYEDGTVALKRYADQVKQYSVEGTGWVTIWSTKAHVESIMAMKVSRDTTFALTVSADHLIVRYDLQAASTPSISTLRAKHPGNGSIAIRDDGKVCAIGGWDGKIRLYSTKSFKSLGTLKYHKQGCQAIEFSRSLTTSNDEATVHCEEEDEMSNEEKERRNRWLVSGGKDNRLCIWELMSFQKIQSS